MNIGAQQKLYSIINNIINNMQPKFITFIQCTFDNKWRHVVGSDEGQEENMAMRNMVVFR